MKAPFSNGRRKLEVLAGLGALIAAAVCADAQSLGLRLAGHLTWPGPPPVAASFSGDSLVVLDETGGVLVVDVSHAQAPRTAGRWTGGDSPVDVTTVDHLACVAGRTNGVQLLDLLGTGAAAPRGIGHYTPDGPVTAITAITNRLFVAFQSTVDGETTAAVDTVDIIRPEAPLRLGRFTVPFESNIRSLTWLRQCLYVEADALYGFDLSVPTRPVRTLLTVFEAILRWNRSRIRLNGYDILALGTSRFSGSLIEYAMPYGIAATWREAVWPTRGNAVDFWVADSLVAIADFPFSWDSPAPPVVDLVRLPPYQEPELAGSFSFTPAQGMPRFIRLQENTVYLGTTEGLLVLSVSTRPSFTGAPERTPAGLRLRWTDDGIGFRLEQSFSLSSNAWQAVPDTDATNEATIPLPKDPAVFFRLVSP